MQSRTLVSFIFVVALLLLKCYLTTGTRWLVLAKMSQLSSIQSTEFCSRLKGLVKRQKQICRRNLEVMDSLRTGAHIAIKECQHQFKNRRWNCSIVNQANLFGNVLKQGTREAAFVHSISSAGVAHAVTRACSSGELQKCGCDRSVRGKSPEGFEWAGCSDNVAFGSAFSKAFVDARERSKRYSGTNRSLMNLHNNEAGRRALHQNMKIRCKCHGVSGSCELKTCWRAVPPFREVGAQLKEKFDGATEVEQQRAGTRVQLMPINTQYKPHTPGDLVYMDASPDFCEPDKRTGSLGTHGRLCNKSSKAIDGCDLMCCGRGFKTKKRTVIERCHCKFYWCCYVKCKECRKEVEEHECN